MNRIIPNYALVMSSKFLNIPFTLAKMADVEGNPRTPLVFCTETQTPIDYNYDKTQVIIWFEMSDLDNDFKGVKEAIKNPELAKLFAGKQPAMQGDLLSTLETDVRILNYSKYKEFMSVNPSWKFKEEVE